MAKKLSDLDDAFGKQQQPEGPTAQEKLNALLNSTIRPVFEKTRVYLESKGAEPEVDEGRKIDSVFGRPDPRLESETHSVVSLRFKYSKKSSYKASILVIWQKTKPYFKLYHTDLSGTPPYAERKKFDLDACDADALEDAVVESIDYLVNYKFQ